MCGEMSRIGIILSSNYVEADLEAVYGKIPPSFLPVSFDRLYKKQIHELAKNCSKIFMTVPTDYLIPTFDLEFLTQVPITIVRLNTDLSICEAILEILELTLGDDSLEFMYGDTLILESLGLDEISISSKPNQHGWGTNGSILLFQNRYHANESLIMSGKFCLSNVDDLKKSIFLSNNDILKALELYDADHKLTYVISRQWYDFGHLSTLQQSKLRVPDFRHFNSITLKADRVTKTSTNLRKLQSEVNWYLSVPESIRHYVPTLISSSNSSYTLSYIDDPTISELLVFGNLEKLKWVEIINGFRLYFLDCLLLGESYLGTALESNDLETLVREKTNARIEELLNSPFSYEDFTEKEILLLVDSMNLDGLFSKIDFNRNDLKGFFHGDLVASNVFWNSSARCLTFVDPRGFEGNILDGLLGDLRYDLAKIYQSLVLGYDFVIAGRYILSQNLGSKRNLSFNLKSSINFEAILNENLFKPLGVDLVEIRSIALLLIIGLLPLHQDRPDRQNAFLLMISEHFKDA